MISPSCNPQLK